uniref:Uncharacterized protein n=1 Tax=Micrurus lemniscatus lemniscatus TaxID=129467 RepID=A0A2D4HGT0_MICLE
MDQLGIVVEVAAQLLSQEGRPATAFGRRDGGPRRVGAAALQDGPLEESAALGGEQVHAHRGGPGALPKEGDRPRIAPKMVDVVLDPLQGQALVQQPHVPRRLWTPREAQKAEGPHAVADGDQDDILRVCQVAAVVNVEGRGAAVESPSVDPDQDGDVPGARGGHPEVEVEAVLAHAPVGVPHLRALEPRVGVVHHLVASALVRRGIQDVLPGFDGLGAQEAHPAHGRLGKGDAQEGRDMAVENRQAQAAHPARLGGYFQLV